MNFGEVLEQLTLGNFAYRECWNNVGTFIFIDPDVLFKAGSPPQHGISQESAPMNYHAHAEIKIATSQVVPWRCSQADLVADDWNVILSCVDED